MADWPRTAPSNFSSAVHHSALVERHEQCQLRHESNEEYLMAKLTHTGPRSHTRERRYRRFNLRYPVKVKLDLGNSGSELRAISNNISLGGILLEANAAIPHHSNVSFIVTVRGHDIIGPTQIAGEGEVVRVEPHCSGAGFAIAVKCNRPISELRGYLPASAS